MSRPRVPLFRRLANWLNRIWLAIRPGRTAWTGATVGLLVVTLVFVISAVIADFGGTDPLGMLIGFLSFVLIGAVAALVGWLALRLLSVPPLRSLAAAIGVLAMLYLTVVSLRPRATIWQLLVGVVVIGSLLGAALWVLARRGWPRATAVQRVIIALALLLGLAGAVGGGYVLLIDGWPVEPPVNAAALTAPQPEPISLADPSQPGRYAVRTLTYGGGQDLHRPEYGGQVTLYTEPIDGSILVGGWSGLRRSYWGFGPEALPLNGRVWYPDGGGPFPLVLIVHGNHIAEYFSDAGYAYLGELLASRGFIAVSVDENFLNLSPSADLGVFAPLTEEDDARAFVLLEHLRTWRAWNETPGNPFHQLADLDRVALIGHSRGGEAVAVAAAFSRLPCYPDNAALRFDYGFGIRAVAAIAPIDGRYMPGGRFLPLENVSYLVLHGAQDMDATAFIGRRVYQRLRFTDEAFHFKAAVYIYGANHGQFNTACGRLDFPPPGSRLFNLGAIMPGDEQRQIAKVYLSAFLEATLHDGAGYLPLWRDARTAQGWLPPTIYLSQYSDTTTRLVSTFEEDLDLSTTTLAGGSQHGENLTRWSEQQPVARDGGRLHTVAAYLGWDSAEKPAPSFTVRLPAGGLELGGQSVLTFALADASPPDQPAGSPIDLTVELVDGEGDSARLPLSHFSAVQPRIRANILKADWLRTQAPSEAVFQSFELALADFVAANPAFSAAGLAEVRLLFDVTPAGLLALDDLGFR